MTKLKYYLLYLSAALCVAACTSNDEEEPQGGNVNPVPEEKQEQVYSSFTESGELPIPEGSAAFEPRSIRISGDSLFIANTAAADRTVYVISRSSGQLLAKINQWERAGATESFPSEIGDIALTSRYLFVGQTNPSRVTVFDRRNWKFVNYIGCASGYGSGITQLIHCYGLHEWNDRLIVRDFNSIRGFWMEEIIKEPAFGVPMIGQVVNGNIKANISSEYYPQALATYKEQIFVANHNNKCIQVLSPAKMKIQWGETCNIELDTLFQLKDIQPTGLAVSGGQLLVSSGGPVVRRYDIHTGQLIDTIATFKNRQLGRIEVSGDQLYFIDNKSKKVITAKGVPL